MVADASYLYDKVVIRDISGENNLSSVDLFISALGFEDRALVSFQRSLERFKPRKIRLLEYPEKGQTKQILNVINSRKLNDITEHIDANDMVSMLSCIDTAENCLLDITGLTKQLIFFITNKALSLGKKIYITYTEADEYYPLEKEIEAKFKETEGHPRYKRFQEIMRNLLIGEQAKYDIVPLLEAPDGYTSRPSILFGFVVSKNQRILSLLDKKEYAFSELFVSSGNDYRSKLAQLAADIAASNYTNVDTILINYKDPSVILKQLFDKYHALYINQGANIEIGLTGTKIETLACAALASVMKVQQCWYVRTKEFDKDRFTKGARETFFYELQKK
jgi:hypothetical protein